MSIFHILSGSRSNSGNKNGGRLAKVPEKMDDKNMNQNEKSRQPAVASNESQLVVDKFNVAAQLMRIGDFELCIEAYKNIAKQYPSRAEDCESQIGAALYFLGRYDESMNYYNKAHVHALKQSSLNSNIK